MMASVKVATSNKFTTTPFRAVYPNLSKTDKFGNFSVDVDCAENPEIEETIRKQIEEFLPFAQGKLETKKKPSNDFVREGEFTKGERKGETFRRIGFKMKGTRKGKDGLEIPQKPMVVDSKLQPIGAAVYGGSLVKVGYILQYTITPTGCFMSVKLRGVQVLEYVGPNSEAAGDYFGSEEGYVAPEQVAVEEEEASDSVPSGTDPGTVKNGRDF